MRTTNLFLLSFFSLATACNHTEKISSDYYSEDYKYDDSYPYDDANDTDTMADEEYDMEEKEDGVYTNPWIQTTDEQTSTFSADVDSGSYTLTRRNLVQGGRPNPSEVRIEEFINYFQYDDVGTASDLPFAVQLESAPSIFGDADDIHLLRIGIQADEIPESERDPVNLIFLLDVSGSMNDDLELVKYAMNHLVDKLSPSDTLGIVVYAGAEGVVLEPTAVENKSEILDALQALEAGGSTNGEAGIEKAYELATQAFRPDGVNRVIICSDGDMNVGLTGSALVDLVAEKRDSGIFLTTLGFGMGNYQDQQMEQLADQGNGNYAYIDSPNEALRVLGDNLVSTLQVVAKDVKIQVSFDPSVVERWRLIGYENRRLDNEDFQDDTVDAGDIGAGHSVTGLYEIDYVDDLSTIEDEQLALISSVSIRYKEPTASQSTQHDWSLALDSRLSSFTEASPSFRFAASVSEFAEILRESPHSEGLRFGDIRDIAQQAILDSTSTPSKEEFIELIGLAEDLY
jgi:Ca-activated chloride channel family protein